MKINRSLRYTSDLFDILDYIAQDKVSAAETFLYELDKRINDLSNFPFKYRKSIYFNDDNIRDLIYQGYTVVYRVDIKNKTIDIFSIFNRNLPPKV